MEQGGKMVTILKVAKHKTALFGGAKIVKPPANLSHLHTYTTVDPDGSSPYLLWLAGGKQGIVDILGSEYLSYILDDDKN